MNIEVFEGRPFQAKGTASNDPEETLSLVNN